jgi:hypothetical protein
VSLTVQASSKRLHGFEYEPNHPIAQFNNAQSRGYIREERSQKPSPTIKLSVGYLLRR